MGMVPNSTIGSGGGIVLQGIGATLGEIYPEYVHGQCAKTDYKLNHLPQNLLMSVLAATTTTRNLSQALMGLSSSAMAAAQTIIAAMALEAHAAQMQALRPKADGAKNREESQVGFRIPNACKREAEAILARAKAAAGGINMVFDIIGVEGGAETASLRVAEQYIKAFARDAKEGMTLLLPTSAGDRSAMIAQAIGIYKKFDRSIGKSGESLQLDHLSGPSIDEEAASDDEVTSVQSPKEGCK